MYPIVKKILFSIPAENAHGLTMRALKIAMDIPLVPAILSPRVRGEEQLKRNICGISFPNPIGVAAGLDKNASFIKELSELGFGFVEIGTVTPKPQQGNTKPRLFRLVSDKALINRMGFNNDGADVIARRIEKLRAKGGDYIIGGNIGKNKTTENANAVSDYLYCLEKLHPYVNYITINVSSPNTPNLRELQDKDMLKKLLTEYQNKNTGLEKALPTFLKIAPDMRFSQVDEIIQICAETGMSGIIAANTTTSRDNLKSHPRMVGAMGSGGLSGAPLTEKSTQLLKHIMTHKPEQLSVISSGGIMNARTATERLDMGAELVELYSGFIYKGPRLISQIKKALLIKRNAQ